MIRCVLGNVGSGKTATSVKYMKENPHKVFYTNIDVSGRGFSHVYKLTAEMIIKKEVISVKRNGEENYKLSLNIDFWRELTKKHSNINVIIDEAHIFFNPRRSMSKLNIIMTDFLALLRRVLGSTDGNGELILITQLSRRLDIIAKEMSTRVTYCIHHYHKRCRACKFLYSENNEQADKHEVCPVCKSYKLERENSVIEIFEFKGFEEFNYWYQTGNKAYYKRYHMLNIKSIFGNYETLQFNDVFSEY